jgi:hypothetical protein
MPTESPHALHLPAVAALATTFPESFPRHIPVALLVALSAALAAPLPARAQAQAQVQAQRVDVCALVACSASGVRSAALTEPARAGPATQPSATPSLPVPASTAPDRATPAAPVRDPWARRVQGRDTQDADACLLNFGLDAQLARKGALETHVLGRTQACRGPAR